MPRVIKDVSLALLIVLFCLVEMMLFFGSAKAFTNTEHGLKSAITQSSSISLPVPSMQISNPFVQGTIQQFVSLPVSKRHSAALLILWPDNRALLGILPDYGVSLVDYVVVDHETVLLTSEEGSQMSLKIHIDGDAVELWMGDGENVVTLTKVGESDGKHMSVDLTGNWRWLSDSVITTFREDGSLVHRGLGDGKICSGRHVVDEPHVSIWLDGCDFILGQAANIEGVRSDYQIRQNGDFLFLSAEDSNTGSLAIRRLSSGTQSPDDDLAVQLLIPSSWIWRNMIGNPDAPIVVEMWCDFFIDGCFDPLLSRSFNELIMSGTVRLIQYMIDETDTYGGYAVECAADQGAYWSFSTSLYDFVEREKKVNLSSKDLAQLAHDNDLDLNWFMTCLVFDEYGSVLNDIYPNYGQLNASTSYPVVRLNGQIIENSQSAQEVANLAAAAAEQFNKDAVLATLGDYPILAQDVVRRSRIEQHIRWFQRDALLQSSQILDNYGRDLYLASLDAYLSSADSVGYASMESLAIAYLVEEVAAKNEISVTAAEVNIVILELLNIDVMTATSASTPPDADTTELEEHYAEKNREPKPEISTSNKKAVHRNSEIGQQELDTHFRILFGLSLDELTNLVRARLLAEKVAESLADLESLQSITGISRRGIQDSTDLLVELLNATDTQLDVHHEGDFGRFTAIEFPMYFWRIHQTETSIISLTIPYSLTTALLYADEIPIVRRHTFANLPPDWVTTRSLGSPDAPVVMDWWGDLVCPACNTWMIEVLPEVIENYIAPGHLRVQFRHFPMQSHMPDAMTIAIALECAGDQSTFWQYYDLVSRASLDGHSSTPPDVTIRQLAMYAARLGIDTEKFTICIESKRHRDEILEAYEEAAARGLYMIPAVEVDGKTVKSPFALGEIGILVDTSHP